MNQANPLPHSKYPHVFAVVRWDGDGSAPENRISVPKVFRTEDAARHEAERLNTVNHDKGCRYFVMVSRLVEIDSFGPT